MDDCGNDSKKHGCPPCAILTFGLEDQPGGLRVQAQTPDCVEVELGGAVVDVNFQKHRHPQRPVPKDHLRHAVNVELPVLVGIKGGQQVRPHHFFLQGLVPHLHSPL